MDESGYLSLRPPPVSSRLRQKRQSSWAAQTLLFLLVSLALCGVLIEAFFMYHLHKTQSDASGSHAKQSGGGLSHFLLEDQTFPIRHQSDPSAESPREVQPSKPVAHLTGGTDVDNKNQIMGWSQNADPIAFGIEYNARDRSLVIKTEGFYNIYSKVSFFDIHLFFHAVHVKTSRYRGKSVPLLVSWTNTPVLCRKEIRDHKSSSVEARGRDGLDPRSNSYLSGVFHLYQGDAIFVKVSNTSQIVRFRPYENIFGAYMI